MGKHVSNIVSMSSGGQIIGAMPVYDFNRDEYITVFTKDGMVKRTKLIDFKVGRYSKEIGMIKLAQGDKVINVSYSNNSDVFVATQMGYGLWYDISEVSVVGIRASGVRSIKLKDDEVVSSYLFDSKDEYLTIITDKGTAKRMKLENIEKTSRANRGVQLMKTIKSNPSKIVSSYIVPKDTELVITSIAEVKPVKLTEIAIMDKQSNGSFIVKDRVLDTYKKSKLVSDGDSNISNTSEDKEDTSKKDTGSVNKEYKALKNIDEKIMTIDEILDEIEDK